MKLLPQTSPQKLQEKKIPKSLKYDALNAKPPQFKIKYQSPQMVNIALIFQNIWGGGGCVAPRTPPTRGKKNSSRIIPCISGKTPASHTYTLHIGAFVTIKCENFKKKKKKKKNTNTNRLGMDSECIFCTRFSPKIKTQNRGRPPPFFCKIKR